MAKRIVLRAVFQGPDPAAIARALIEHGVLPAGPPDSALVDDVRGSASAAWPEQLPAGARTLAATWGEHCFVNLTSSWVQLAVPDFELAPEALVDLLAKLPFTLASFATLHPIWGNKVHGPGYKAPGFPDSPWSMGWGCAFRGDGHDRVVSRRWLDHGPWRTLRAAADTTLVQFHDLGADAKVSAEQARPGHQLLSMAPSAGMLPRRGVYTFGKLSGPYSAEQRKLRVVIGRRDIASVEMRDAAAARVYQPLGAEQPIDSVCFVFGDEDNLDRYLPVLWLYGIEVNQVDGSGERRVDNRYRPPLVNKPSWVVALGRDDKLDAGTHGCAI